MKPPVFSCLASRTTTSGSLYGRFLFGPLPVDISLTLATILRRSLLHTKAPFTIVSAEIEGAMHEYAALPGIQESVLEILLNLGEVVLTGKRGNLLNPCFRSYCGNNDKFKSQTYIASLRISGPCIVRAKDINWPDGILCVKPQTHIATLSGNNTLAMRIKIMAAVNINKNSTAYSTKQLPKKFLRTDTLLSQKEQSSKSLQQSAISSTEDKGVVPSTLTYLSLPESGRVKTGSFGPPPSSLQLVGQERLKQKNRLRVGTNYEPEGRRSFFYDEQISVKLKSTFNLKFTKGQKFLYTWPYLLHQTEGQEFLQQPKEPELQYISNKPKYPLRLTFGRLESVNYSDLVQGKVPVRYRVSGLWAQSPSTSSNLLSFKRTDNQNTERGSSGLSMRHKRRFNLSEGGSVANKVGEVATVRRTGLQGVVSSSKVLSSGFERNKAASFNGLAVSSSFYPIEKVNFVIERDDQLVGYRHRIIFEIWTNGSISPRQAVFNSISWIIKLLYNFRESTAPFDLAA